MSQTEQDLFFYNGDGIGFENLAKYKAGGFHPIVLGDVLPERGSCIDDFSREPRYRIAQKLGFGGFSTVWLARDIEQGYVALKVCQGLKDSFQNNETKILRHIHQVGYGKPGYHNIIEIYDSFSIRGPNGIHECLITEVVIPLSSISVRERCSPEHAILQIFRAFSFLHKEGVTHGDPHYSNFGIAIPQLQTIEEGTIADHFADPTVIPVVPRDPQFQRNSIPNYITETISLESLVGNLGYLPQGKEIVVKVFDFGRATLVDRIDRILQGAAPPTVRPPEVYMYTLSNGKIGSNWSEEADIWAMGCIAYQIKTGCQLLQVQGDSQYQLYQALRLGGAPPKDWSAFWKLETLCETTKNWKYPVPPFFDTERAWESRRPKNDPRSKIFLDLIRKMVVTDPCRRGPIAVLFEHPYLAERGPLPNIQ